MTQRAWDVFECGGIWEIQRDDEANIYADDEEAIRACCEAARQGDRYAVEAVIAIAFQDPEEWPAFLASLRAQAGSAGELLRGE